MPGAFEDRRLGTLTSVAVKAPCKAVTTTAITLNGEKTVGGVACVTGDRVLVAIAGGSVSNGIWVVDTGDWARAKDFDGSRDVVKGTIVLVAQGSTSRFWQVATDNPVVIGATLIVFEQLDYSATSAPDSTVIVQQPAIGTVARTQHDKNAESVSVLDFGADATGVADSTAAFAAALVTGKKVHVPAGTYLANIAPTAVFNIEGDGMELSIIKPFNAALPVVKNMYDNGAANFWRRARIAQLSIRSTGATGNGFTFGDPALYTINDERIGRVDFDSVEITGFNKAVFKTCGNIGNTFRSCRVQNNNYNYYAQSSDYASGAAPAMHSGLDLFDGGAWGYASLANIFIRDRIGGKGGWTFTNDVDLEGSTGYNIVYLASTTDFGYVPDLIVDTSWLEANATGGSITIDGLTGTITGLPYDFYVSGGRHVMVKNGFIGKVNLLNGSNMVAEKCGTDTVTANVFSLTKDASSTFIWDGSASITGLPGQLNVGPWSYINRNTISETPVYNVPNSEKFEVAKDVTVLAGFSFGAKKFPGIVVIDGMGASRCNEFAVGAGVPVDIVPAVTTVAGRYYAVSIQIRLASGTNGSVTVGNLAANLAIDHSEWRQYAFVKAATTTSATVTLSAASGTSTMRVGHVQIVEFTTADAALAYLLRGRMAINSDARSALLPLSAFTDANGGAGASFNSAVISQTIPGTAVALCEVNLRNTTLAKVQLDMLLAIDDQSTGAALTQPVGFSSVTFATTASTPTLVLGASTVTFSLVNIGGTVWELRASQTGSAAGLAVSGLAFIKGH